MYTVIIALIAGGLSYGISLQTFGASENGYQHGWPAFVGSAVALVIFGVLMRVFGKRLQESIGGVQGIIENGRDEANRYATRIQGRGKGMSPKLIQGKVEKIMGDAIDEAILALDAAKPLYNWAIFAERQVTTLKMQLSFQNKNFEEVDKLLPKCMMFDPMTVSMKMAREYQKKEDEQLIKTFEKGSKRFKGEKAILVYSTYAWMMIKRKQMDKALEVLNTAKGIMISEDIERNWQAIANNKPGQFSNAFLGDQWYALHLELPKQAKARAGKGDARRDPRIGKVNRKMR